MRRSWQLASLAFALCSDPSSASLRTNPVHRVTVGPPARHGRVRVPTLVAAATNDNSDEGQPQDDGVSLRKTSTSSSNSSNSSRRPNVPSPWPPRLPNTQVLAVELSGICVAQLVWAIYSTVNDPLFPGWTAAVTADTLSSPRLLATLANSALLSLFWVVSYSAGTNLQQPMFSFRLENVFEFSALQWVNVVNLFILTQLCYSYVTHVPALGLEVPLIAGFVGIFLSRVYYYNIV